MRGINNGFRKQMTELAIGDLTASVLQSPHDGD